MYSKRYLLFTRHINFANRWPLQTAVDNRTCYTGGHTLGATNKKALIILQSQSVKGDKLTLSRVL